MHANLINGEAFGWFLKMITIKKQANQRKKNYKAVKAKNITHFAKNLDLEQLSNCFQCYSSVY